MASKVKEQPLPKAQGSTNMEYERVSLVEWSLLTPGNKTTIEIILFTASISIRVPFSRVESVVSCMLGVPEF